MSKKENPPSYFLVSASIPPMIPSIGPIKNPLIATRPTMDATSIAEGDMPASLLETVAMLIRLLLWSEAYLRSGNAVHARKDTILISSEIGINNGK